MSEPSRRALVALPVLVLAPSARGEDAAPRITLNPALGVEHRFSVRYRHGRSDASGPVGAVGGIAVDYRLSVTALAREDGDRFRLRVSLSDLEWPDRGRSGADMVVTAAAMLDGLPFEVVTGTRSARPDVIDWSALARTLRERAVALPTQGAQVIGLSVVDGHTAEQAYWHLTRALDGMGFARSYLSFAERTGSSTITWFGTRIDVVVERRKGGGASIRWSSPGGGAPGPATNYGRADLRADGLADFVLATSSPSGGGSLQTFRVEALPAR